MKLLAIIPARSGSKGLPDKNIRPLCGTPLMAYSIRAALNSSEFDTVHVSTDSEKYADIARSFGADLPFLRSAATASDTASSWTAVREVLTKYTALGRDFDAVMLLQPTSPLRTAADIQNAVRLYREREARAVISVCETDHSPLWCNTLPADRSLTSFLRPEVLNQPRQQMETFYRLNGAIYLVSAGLIAETDDIYAEKSYAYVMDRRTSVDIDDLYDFAIAEAILQKGNELQ